MRFASIHLRAYGHFTDTRLDLDEGAGLHLLLGPNEAGKSTLLRALSALLFGHPHHAVDAFLHATREISVGARLVAASGEEIVCYRRRGQNSLRGPDDGVLPANCLHAFLGGAEQAFFDKVFGLDYQRLRDGGDDLLSEKGDLGYSLFEAGSGLVGVHAVLNEMHAEARELWLRAGAKPTINAGLARYRDLRRQAHDRLLGADEWKGLRERRDAARRTIDEAQAALHGLRTEIARRERIARNQPRFAARRRYLDEIGPLAHLPELPPGAADERRAAETALAEAASAAGAAGKALDALERRAAAALPDPAILALAEPLRRLPDSLGAVTKAAADLDRREGQQTQLRREIESLLGEAGLPRRAEAARASLPSRAALAAAKSLLIEHGKLEAGAAPLRKSVADMAAEEAELVAALDALPAAADASPLAEAIETATRHGDLDALAGQAERLLDRRRTALSDRLAALPLRSGDATALARLPVPLEATVRRFEIEAREADEAARLAAGKRGQIAARLAEIDDRVAALGIGAALVGEADLAAARAHRERGWRLVRAIHIDGTEGADAARPYAGERPLPDAYEAAVLTADDAADALRRDAGAAARHAELLDQRRGITAELEHADGAVAAAAEAAAERDRHWRAAWADCGIVPLSPAEMLDWLRRREAIQADAAAVAEAEAEVARLATLADTARRGLAAALGRDAATEPLPALLAQARRAIAERDRIEKQRNEAMAGLRRLRRRIERDRDELAANAAAGENWRRRWLAAASAAGLDPAAELAAAEAQIGLVDEIASKLDGWDAVTRQVDAIREDRRAFDAEVRALGERLGIGADDTIEAARALGERLKRAETADRIHGEAAVERRGLEAERAAAEERAKSARAALGRLCRQAGCGDAAELPQIEERVRRRAELRRLIETLEGEIVADAAGMALVEVERACAAEDPDGLRQTLVELIARAAEIDERRLAARGELGEVEERIRALGASADAAAALEDVEAEAAALEAPIARYVQLALGQALLRRAVERYREENQAPLLARAGAIFARVTDGAFAGIEADYDEKGAPYVLGRRAAGGTVRVEEMSTGTRDQLYLALRLAVVEEHVAAHEPLPFIADDICINFDDARAAATLGYLADLAGRTQVLFFTHHGKMAELARAAVDPARLRIHELPAAPLAPRHTAAA